MMKGENEGIALLTQYNGHGIFIALEELGYITMSISLFFLAPVFSSSIRLEKSLRWILFLPFISEYCYPLLCIQSCLELTGVIGLKWQLLLSIFYF